MNKNAQGYSLFSHHGQIVLWSVPVALIGLPISLLVSFFAPELPLPFGLTGRQLPIVPWIVVMLSLALLADNYNSCILTILDISGKYFILP